MHANLELFLEHDQDGHVPLILFREVEGSRCLGSEGLTAPSINVIWCNASACSWNALVIQHPPSISMTSEDGTD